jgi:peptide/nickel transport system permease protein
MATTSPVTEGSVRRLGQGAARLVHHPTLRFVVRRALHGLFVAFLVLVTVFFVTRVIADPARVMLGTEGTVEQYEALRQSLGLDKAIPAQFVTYMGDLVTFDFGDSYRSRTAVSELVLGSLDDTLLLVFAGMAFAWIAGILLGVLASLRPGTWSDQAVSALSMFGLSLPHFWLGSMLILVFAVVLPWFPTSGSGGLDHLVLPALALGLPSMGRIAQITRSAVIAQASAQYVVVARAKGLSRFYVLVRHVMRNCFVPIVTICSWEWVSSFAAYAIVVETVFGWPGMGQLLIRAIQIQDLTVVQGVVVVLALIVAVANILADVAYKVIDPRIELG